MFTGPYIDWPVANGESGWPEWAFQLGEEETLEPVSVAEVLPQTALVDGQWHNVHRYIPLARRPGHPTRGLQWDFIEMKWYAENLSDVKPAAEMRWFAKAFAPELRRLAEYYGQAGLVRWGVLCLMLH
jgi:hypothetical protein